MTTSRLPALDYTVKDGLPYCHERRRSSIVGWAFGVIDVVGQRTS
jgi:hypothetical protein